jgi:basic membrane protein A
VRLLLALGAVLLLSAAAAAVGAAGPAGQRLRVGYVMYAGGRTDRGVFQASYEGFRRAIKRLGLTGRVLELPPLQNPEHGLATLARQRYDLVIDAAPHYDRGAVTRVAAAFPKVKLLVQDIEHGSLPGAARNVQTFVFRIQEAGYLAGYLAASMEKRRPGKDVVGAVGGLPIVQVTPFIAGYRAGARRADPGVTTLHGYSNDFAGPAKCRSLALSQIGRGAGVIFNVAGYCGLGALDAARKKGVWGIGVDIDQSFLGPHILTSAVKHYDVAYYRELKALKNGTFRTGGTTWLGVRENGVGLGKISPKVPRAFVKQLDRIRAEIAAGRIRVPSLIR